MKDYYKKKKSDEEQIYIRPHGQPHKDWQINKQATEYFMEKYASTFEPWITIKLMYDKEYDTEGHAPYRYVRFDYEDRKGHKRFTTVSLHEAHEETKTALCNTTRAIMQKLGITNAFTCSWSEFLNETKKYILARELRTSMYSN